ncbi:hypothetical protein DICA0_E37808 [Diutina catenulata]
MAGIVHQTLALSTKLWHCLPNSAFPPTSELSTNPNIATKSGNSTKSGISTNWWGGRFCYVTSAFHQLWHFSVIPPTSAFHQLWHSTNTVIHQL